MSDEKRYEKLEAAIAGGLIGAALGALFTRKKESAIISSLVGAALGATYSAFKESQKFDSGVLYEENGCIFRLFPNGEKTLIKYLDKQAIQIPNTFTLD